MTPQGQLAHQIRTIRERRGWSQPDLVKRLAEHGVVWHAITVSKVEQGKRGVSLDEAVALAAVLGVAPVQLLSGALGDEPIEVTPKTTLSPHQALRWFRGQLPLDPRDEATYHAEVDPVEWTSQMATLMDAMTETMAQITDAAAAALDGAPPSDARDRAAALIEQYNDQQLRFAGYRRAYENRTR